MLALFRSRRRLAELFAKVLNVCFWQMQSSRFCSSPDALLRGGEDNPWLVDTAGIGAGKAEQKCLG
jgi:hypothetical protein